VEQFGVIFFILIVAAILIGSLVFGAQRRKAFQELATRLGMTYTRKDRALPREFKFLDRLRRGHSRYASNILMGDYRGHPVVFFDFHYTTGSGKSQQHHCESFFILRQDKAFPELRIYPETLFSRLGQMMGFEDIDFESLEFSKAFVVKSRDKKFAYDICHPRMMEYLLGHRSLSLEIEDRFVALGCNRRLKPEQCPERLDVLVGVRELFPRYLYES
jgi:hypothetical protein